MRATLIFAASFGIAFAAPQGWGNFGGSKSDVEPTTTQDYNWNTWNDGNDKPQTSNYGGWTPVPEVTTPAATTTKTPAVTTSQWSQWQPVTTPVAETTTPVKETTQWSAWTPVEETTTTPCPTSSPPPPEPETSWATWSPVPTTPVAVTTPTVWQTWSSVPVTTPAPPAPPASTVQASTSAPLISTFTGAAVRQDTPVYAGIALIFAAVAL